MPPENSSSRWPKIGVHLTAIAADYSAPTIVDVGSDAQISVGGVQIAVVNTLAANLDVTQFAFV